MNELIDQTLGQYHIVEKIGAGGMAMVHRATKRGIEGIEPVVALKRLLPQLADNEDAVRAFVREAKERAARYDGWSDQELWDHVSAHPVQGIIDL